MSCSDTTGLPGFARDLERAGLSLLASVGTRRALAAAGIDSESLEGYTRQMPGSHAKTLQAKLHEGIFADPSDPGDRDRLERMEALPITVVCCTLYPLEEKRAAGMVEEWDALYGLLDIGGPALIANAAKHHDRVLCATDPADYPEIAQALAKPPEDGRAYRKYLAGKAFARLADYHRGVADAFRSLP